MFKMETSNSTPQIRLKEALLGVCIAGALTMWLAQPAKAAGDAVCENYASAAVAQQGVNLTEDCRLTGFRWHGWRDGHYSWCKGVSANRARKETARRWRDLDNCHNDF